MKISYSWLKEFVKLPIGAEDLANRLLLLGFEVSAMERRGSGFSGVIVTQILEISKHPNADRLSLCKVTDGVSEQVIVCGAKNISVGQKVPLARPGAVLPGGKTIQRSVIRGAESHGMLCSAEELGLPTENNGVLVLSEDVELGQDVSHLVSTEDWILDVEVTPNRPDVLSHFGLARELAAYFRLPLERPGAHEVPSEGHPLHVSVEAPEACPRYVGRELSGLAVRPSPSWMAARLQSVGVRPINNVVDVTNYVLLEMGQPLHAFDADLLEEQKVRVRYARAEEKLLALDGREYVLGPDCLVIADGRRPAALAGVIGGSESAVSEKTKRVFLESANFAPAVVRRTSRRFKLRTESSYRFERGVDPEAAAAAGARAAHWILKTAGGRATLANDHYPAPSRPHPIVVSFERLRNLLDTPISQDRAEERMRRLSEQIEKTPGGWTLTPPSWRPDLAHVQDIAEEVARLDGYELIPETASPVPPALPHPDLTYAVEETLRERLLGLGFLEAFNYDFVSLGDLERCGLGAKEALAATPALENSLSADWQYLRPTLLIGLIKSLARNLNRGASDVRLCEIGKVYASTALSTGGSTSLTTSASTVVTRVMERNTLAAIALGRDPEGVYWQSAQSHELDLYRVKGFLKTLFAGWPNPAWHALPSENRLLHPGLSSGVYVGGKLVGAVGRLHPVIAEAWELKGRAAWVFELDLEAVLSLPPTPMKYRPLPAFPSVERDLSLVFEESVSWDSVQRSVLAQGRPLLKQMDLVDVFTGGAIPKGSRSLTLRLRFQLPDRTLTDEEVDASVQKILKALESELKGKLRT